MKKRLLLISGFLFIAAESHAQTWLWAKQSQGSLKADLFASNVATNRTGNVYQAGCYANYIMFGSATITSPADEDIFLVKYDPNGNVLWAQTSKGTPNSFQVANSVATDDSDNVYVEGYGDNLYQGHTDTVSFGAFTLHLSVKGNSFLVKYNPNGKVLWAIQSDTTLVPNINYGWLVTADKFSHEYVSGVGAFLLKYDRSGNFKWSVSNPSNFNLSIIATGLSTDASGNIYMSGFFQDTLTLGNKTLYSFNLAQFVAKFDSSGNVLWAQKTNGNRGYSVNTKHNSITVDKNNAAYLTGSYMDSIEFGNTLLTDIDSLTNTFYVVKFNPSGSVAWARQAIGVYDTSNIGWSTYSISSDDSNHIYLTGAWLLFYRASPLPPFIFANDTINILDTGTHDNPVFMLELDSTGSLLCSSTLTAGGDFPAITTDSTGRFVYIGGEFFEDFNIGNNLMTNSTGGDNCFVGRWQSCNACNLAVAAPPSPYVCNGDSALLTISGAVSYTWSPSAGLSATTGNSVMAAPTLTTTYTISYLDNDCAGSVQCVVKIKQLPNKPVITVSVTGDTLFSSAHNGNQWFVNGQAITGATDSFFVIKGLPLDDSVKVQVIDLINGCSNVSDIFTTGINQLSVNDNQLSIYPNPSTGLVTITSAQTINDVTVTNLVGQVIYTAQPKQTTFNFELKDEGMYFVTITSGNEMVTRKLVVNR